MKKVVVDIFGGDNAPYEIIDGCILALSKHRDIVIVMVGKQEVIAKYLAEKSAATKNSEIFDRIEIVDAPEVVTNDDIPTVALRAKTNSSLVKALYYTKDNEDAIGLVSAGSTGAVLVGATLKIKRMKGVMRPALAPVLPTLIDGKKVLLVDCGANVECKPQMLVQFAEMGAAFMESIYKIDNPKIGLLSNGTEEKKGSELVQETFKLLKASKLNFAGNMEGREILSGDFDVVVADGFSGNIALKTCEGTAITMLKIIKSKITSSFFRKLGAAILKPAFKEVQQVMDYNKSGGAPFLGVNKIVIKSHGSSKAAAICGSIEQVWEFDRNNLIDNLKPYFENAQISD